MQSSWPAAHSQALREYLAMGMSFSRIADAINAQFGTRYSRNAMIGRARRMGLVRPAQPGDRSVTPRKASTPHLQRPGKRRAPRRKSPASKPAPAKRRKLRCVEIAPRHLTLMELGPGDCRYPYGGDVEGEAISFCGHPQRVGSSYCAPHFRLTRGGDAPEERADGLLLLRLLEAAA